MYFPVHALIFCRSIITFSLHLYLWPCGLRGRAVREQRGLVKPKVTLGSGRKSKEGFILSYYIYSVALCILFFIVPFSLVLSFINSFLIFHSKFPIVLGPPGLILWSAITSREDSHARNAWGVGSFNFNTFRLCFKIKLTVALARKHIIFYICVCVFKRRRASRRRPSTNEH